MLETLQQSLEAIPYGLYLCFLIFPFIQEDAAVIGAAAASSAGLGAPAGLFAALLVGLTFSDIWKYGLGRLARSRGWAEKYARNPKVQTARDRIVDRLATTLLAVRFIPGTRIPTYVAAGYFRAPFWPFVVFLTFAGVVFCLSIFVLFHALGAVAGERAKTWLPAIAIIMVIGLLSFQWWRGRRAARLPEA